MRLGVFPGSFNPPTRAHLALIDAAGAHVDEVRVVLPRRFPHKLYHGATLEQRIKMIETLKAATPFSVGISEGGLFLEIARECRDIYGPDAELWFLCGRDAAERILDWDYGREGAVDEMMQKFGLLVGARRGEFEVPPRFAHRIRQLVLRTSTDDFSSTEVRTRIERREPWRHLVPDSTANLIEAFYAR
jgi:cytidyltransferase-like protein